MVAPDSITPEVMDKMAELIDDLSEGIGGLPGMIKTYTQCISVAGECYLIQYKGEWSIRSTDEVTVRASDGRAILRTLRSGGSSATGRLREIELPQRTFVGRIWRPHPRYSDEPDSSMIAVRELCDELLTVQRMIRTTARSRMNGGLMIVADSVTAASSSPAGDIEEAEEEADAFEQELMLALTTPVSDESSAMTIGPMVARAPAEIVREAINYQSFSRDADKSLVERADRVLDRIMQGIDIPKDIVTGLANIKYANAIKIDESLYKSHVEPLALMLCDAITSVYFRPALKAAFPDLAPEDLKKLVAWYDPTEVVTKPDPAAAADQGYQRFTLTPGGAPTASRTPTLRARRSSLAAWRPRRSRSRRTWQRSCSSRQRLPCTRLPRSSPWRRSSLRTRTAPARCCSTSRARRARRKRSFRRPPPRR